MSTLFISRPKRNMSALIYALAGLLILGLCPQNAAAQAQKADRSAPQIVRTSCYMCHSTQGNTPDLAFIPRLAAQNQSYIEDQLKAFRDGSRSGPAATIYMWPIAQGLSDAQIQQAAAWFASQSAPTPFPPGSSAGEGRDIFMHGILKADIPACDSCHGAKAEGNGIFPRLAGQNAQYLIAQMRYFRSGVRNEKNSEIMKQIVLHMTDAQISAVAEYLSSL